MMQAQCVVLLGPPGAGKGTQAQRLARSSGALHLATGDLLREAVRRGTELGRAVQPVMEAGGLVPDALVIALLEETIAAAGEQARKGVLFDGFPRTRGQLQALDEMLARCGGRIDRAVLIAVPDEVLVERLSQRRSCAQCGAVYNLVHQPPRTEGVCDACGAKRLEQRSDDRPQTIRERLRKYREDTAPLIALFRERGLLISVDGRESVEEVQAALAQAVGLDAA